MSATPFLIAPFLIAEAGVNHNGDLGRALAMVDAAADAGADAVKFQSFRTDALASRHAGAAPYQRAACQVEDQRALLRRLELTPEMHAAIIERCRVRGIEFLSTPFDLGSLEFLAGTKALKRLKLGSGEVTNGPLLLAAARTGLPLILSTGMATLEEIAEAVEAARGAGATEIVVLHCTAAYPAPPEEANLATIAEIARRFDVIAGLSDHTLGTVVPGIAIALGADVIEKHFTLDRAEGGVDSVFSLEPAELTELVRNSRIARQTVGAPAFAPTASEATVLKNRRSLYVVAPIAQGEAFTPRNVRSIRPGLGMKPKHLESVLGRVAARDITFGEALDASMIDGEFQA